MAAGKRIRTQVTRIPPTWSFVNFAEMKGGCGVSSKNTGLGEEGRFEYTLNGAEILQGGGG